MRGIPAEQLTPGGTLRAVYERDIPNPESGKAEFAVGNEAFEAVRLGYACGNCLEYAAFRGAYLPVCPTCGEPTGGYQVTAPWWT